MRKSLILIASIVSLSASSCIFADNFDPESIKQIHTQVQSNMSQRCLSEIPHATQAMCDCLGNKLQSNIDDAALSKCAKDSSGKECVMKVAQDATTKTITPATMKECMPETTPAAASSTTTTTTTTMPAAAPAASTTMPAVAPATTSTSTSTSMPAANSAQ